MRGNVPAVGVPPPPQLVTELAGNAAIATSRFGVPFQKGHEHEEVIALLYGVGGDINGLTTAELDIPVIQRRCELIGHAVDSVDPTAAFACYRHSGHPGVRVLLCATTSTWPAYVTAAGRRSRREWLDS